MRSELTNAKSGATTVSGLRFKRKPPCSPVTNPRSRSSITEPNRIISLEEITLDLTQEGLTSCSAPSMSSYGASLPIDNNSSAVTSFVETMSRRSLFGHFLQLTRRLRTSYHPPISLNLVQAGGLVDRSMGGMLTSTGVNTFSFSCIVDLRGFFCISRRLGVSYCTDS